MYLGKDKHILTFPIQEGKILNVVCFASDRTPSPDDPIWNSDNWIVDSTEEEMLQGWEGWSDDCLAIMKVCLNVVQISLLASADTTACLTGHQRPKEVGTA